MIRAWLRKWLGIDAEHQEVSDFADYVGGQVRQIGVLHSQMESVLSAIAIMQTENRELRAEVTRLQLERYVPPQTPEPERKIIKTQTFKQFQDILEREQEESNAV